MSVYVDNAGLGFGRMKMCHIERKLRDKGHYCKNHTYLARIEIGCGHGR